jgi:hypothetical protein
MAAGSNRLSSGGLLPLTLLLAAAPFLFAWND